MTNSNLVDSTISDGDFVVTGGELPAMTIVDSIARLVSGYCQQRKSQRKSHLLMDC